MSLLVYNERNLPFPLLGAKKKPSPALATVLGLLLTFAFCPHAAHAATITVSVGAGGFRFSPASVTIQPGDTVQWTWSAGGHSTTSGSPGSPTGIWDSGILNQGATFSHTFPTAGSFPYYCAPHGSCCGMTGMVTVSAPSPTPAPTPTPSPGQLLNISTRMRVLTGDSVLIGGFIVTGTEPKKVLIRGMGPSLPLTGVLANPTLELHDASRTLATNDNWQDDPSQAAEIQATGIPPKDSLEAAIVATLPANNARYTAILAGKNSGTGIGLVEVYDLAQGANSRLANISTRGFVDTNDNVMIGGFIVGGPSGNSAKVLIRAIGPSLPLSGALQDPTLELHNGDGTTAAANDNWKDTQQQAIMDSGVPPADDRESAIVATLSPGNYTAVLRGKNNTTGLALVEVYNLP